MPRILTINIDGTGYDLGVKATEITATWAANAATCTVSNSVINQNSIIMLQPPTNKADFEALCNAEICMTSQAAGSITLTALGTPPSSAVAFKLVVLM